MADFIATAKVRIAPDLTGFRATLRTSVQNAVKQAGKHSILITPSTVGFGQALRTQVKARVSEAGIQSVPVKPQLTAFRAEFATELRKNPVLVPVVPDMTAFQAELTARIATINESLPPVVVPVVSGTGTGGGKARENLANSTEKAASATAKLTAAERGLLDQSRAIGQIEENRAKARNQHNAALNTQNSLEERSRSIRSAQRTISEALETTEAKLSATSQKTAGAFRDRLKTQRDRLASESSLVNVTAQSIRGEQLFAKSSDVAAKATDSANKAISQSTEGFKKASQFQKVSVGLGRAEAEVKSALVIARKAENSAAVQSLTTLESEVVARQAVVTAEREQIVTTGKLASKRAFAARGAGATLGSLLDIRGATLAANASFLAGAAAVATFAKAVKSAADLQQELNVFRVTAKATGDEMERVSNEARKLGADVTLPAVSAGDAAQAMSELAKAGLDVEDSLAGARGVLQLATAAQISNADATLLVASALNAFQRSGEDATTVADLLTGAAIESQGSITDMGTALQQAAAVARQAGISLEDTVAMITLLARNGLRGSDAGTSLRTAILRLINPTDKASAALESLNVRLRDTEGNIRPEAFAEMSAALADLGKKQRDATLAMIFGQDAFRAAAILGREGATGLNEMRAATQEEGLALSLASARTEGFSGSIQGLSNALSTLGTNIGSVTLIPLTKLVTSITDGVTVVNDLTTALEHLAKRVNIKIPPIKIDFEAGPIKVKADKEGFDAGDIFGKAFNRGLDLAIGAALSVGFPGFAKAVAATEAIKQLRLLRGSASDTADDVQRMFDTFREAGGGTTNLNKLALGLQGMIESLKGGDEEAQRLGKRLEVILKFIQDTGKLPPVPIRFFLEQPDFKSIKAPEIVFPTRTIVDKSKQTGDDIGTNLLDSLNRVVSPDVMKALGFGIVLNLSKGAQEGLKQVQPFTQDQLEGKLFPSDLAISRAEAFGTDRDVLAKNKARLKVVDQLLKSDQINAKQEKTLLDERATLRREIESIEQGFINDQETAARNAEERAGKAQDAADKRDQAFLDLLGGRRTRVENLILRAGGSESLKDDIRFNVRMRELIEKQMDQIRKTVKNSQIKATELAALTRLAIQIGLTIKQLKEQARQAFRNALEDKNARIRESIELDIELASTRGNINAEIRARERLIALLHKLQAKTKKGTLEYKRLRNEIAAEQKAIDDLKKQNQERNNKFAELSFQFLQSQQGFAATLFGNLLPMGAIGGTVGGTTGGGGSTLLPHPSIGGTSKEIGRGADSIDDSIQRKAALGKAGEGQGGQMGQLIHLTRQIVQLLGGIHGRAGHPEARYQRISSGSSMDTM